MDRAIASAASAASAATAASGTNRRLSPGTRTLPIDLPPARAVGSRPQSSVAIRCRWAVSVPAGRPVTLAVRVDRACASLGPAEECDREPPRLSGRRPACVGQSDGRPSHAAAREARRPNHAVGCRAGFAALVSRGTENPVAPQPREEGS